MAAASTGVSAPNAPATADNTAETVTTTIWARDRYLRMFFKELPPIGYSDKYAADTGPYA